MSTTTLRVRTASLLGCAIALGAIGCAVGCERSASEKTEDAARDAGSAVSEVARDAADAADDAMQKADEAIGDAVGN